MPTVYTFADPTYRANVEAIARQMYLAHELSADQYAEAMECLAVIGARRG